MKTRSIAIPAARRSASNLRPLAGLFTAALLGVIAGPASAQVDRQTHKIPAPPPLQGSGQYMRSPSRQGVLRAKAVIFHPVGKTASRTTATSNYFATQAELKKCDDGEPSSLRPSIDTVQGTIESSGDIVISGRCFGYSGVVVFTGAFPSYSGRFNGETEAWSPERIRVHIPSVEIFHSTQVSISVFRAVDNVDSDAVTHAFDPEMEDVVLPANQVVNLACPHDAGQCVSATANHVASNGGATFTASNGRPANESGDDRWEAKPPAGWLVDWIEWTTPLGTVSLGPDFMTSPATDAVWTMHWENNLLAPGVQPPGNSVRLSGDSRQYYAASYSMKVHVIGPKGTFPLRRS